MEYLDTSDQRYADEFPEEPEMAAYMVEYAKSERSACKGRKPCNGTKIGNGELRLGVLTKFGTSDHEGYIYRHWGCVTKAQFINMRELYLDASMLGGFDELRPEDQQRVKYAFDVGYIPLEDLSELSPDFPRPTEALDDGGESSTAAIAEPPVKDEQEKKPKPKKAPAKGRKRKAESSPPASAVKVETAEVEDLKPAVPVKAPPKKGRGRGKKVKFEQDETTSREMSVDSNSTAMTVDDDVKPSVGAKSEAGSSSSGGRQPKRSKRTAKAKAPPVKTQADGKPVRRSSRRGGVKEEVVEEEVKPSVASEQVEAVTAQSSPLSSLDDALEKQLKSEETDPECTSPQVDTDAVTSAQTIVEAKMEPVAEDAQPAIDSTATEQMMKAEEGVEHKDGVSATPDGKSVGFKPSLIEHAVDSMMKVESVEEAQASPGAVERHKIEKGEDESAHLPVDERAAKTEEAVEEAVDAKVVEGGPTSVKSEVAPEQPVEREQLKREEDEDDRKEVPPAIEEDMSTPEQSSSQVKVESGAQTPSKTVKAEAEQSSADAKMDVDDSPALESDASIDQLEEEKQTIPATPTQIKKEEKPAPSPLNKVKAEPTSPVSPRAPAAVSKFSTRLETPARRPSASRQSTASVHQAPKKAQRTPLEVKTEELPSEWPPWAKERSSS